MSNNHPCEAIRYGDRITKADLLLMADNWTKIHIPVTVIPLPSGCRVKTWRDWGEVTLALHRGASALSAVRWAMRDKRLFDEWWTERTVQHRMQEVKSQAMSAWWLATEWEDYLSKQRWEKAENKRLTLARKLSQCR